MSGNQSSWSQKREGYIELAVKMIRDGKEIHQIETILRKKGLGQRQVQKIMENANELSRKRKNQSNCINPVS